MHIHKSPLLEELMNRIRDQRAYAKYSLERIGSWAQMRDGTQIFQRMTFFLQRIIRRRITFHHHFLCLDLKRLFCLRSSHQCTFYDYSSPHIQMSDLVKILQLIAVYHLDRLKKGTVMHHQKSKVF